MIWVVWVAWSVFHFADFAMIYVLVHHIYQQRHRRTVMAMIDNGEYAEVSASVIDRKTQSDGCYMSFCVLIEYEWERNNLRKSIQVSEQEYGVHADDDTMHLWVLNGYPKSGLPVSSYRREKESCPEDANIVAFVVLTQVAIGLHLITSNLVLFYCIFMSFSIVCAIMIACYARNEARMESLDKYIERTTNVHDAEEVCHLDQQDTGP